MASTYLVDVDLAQVRAQRSRAENRPLSDQEVRSWLLNYGFYPRMDGLYLAEDEWTKFLGEAALARWAFRA